MCLIIIGFIIIVLFIWAERRSLNKQKQGENRLCINCAFYKKNKFSDDCLREVADIDRINGKKSYHSCRFMRNDFERICDTCGPEGKYFKDNKNGEK